MAQKYLKQVHLFKNLQAPDLRKIAKIADQERFKAGTVIFAKEEVGNHFFIVSSGRIKIFTSASGKRTKTLAYLMPGDFFGEMALLGGKLRSASAMAVEDSSLIVINKHNFRRLITTDSHFTMRLLSALSERLRHANEEIEGLLFHNMLGRLACAMLALVRGRGPGARINMNLSELADFVGTTREPLSRVLSVMRNAGILEYKDKTIIIKDIKRLTSMAQQLS